MNAFAWKALSYAYISEAKASGLGLEEEGMELTLG